MADDENNEEKKGGIPAIATSVVTGTAAAAVVPRVIMGRHFNPEKFAAAGEFGARLGVLEGTADGSIAHARQSAWDQFIGIDKEAKTIPAGMADPKVVHEMTAEYIEGLAPNHKKFAQDAQKAIKNATGSLEKEAASIKKLQGLAPKYNEAGFFTNIVRKPVTAFRGASGLTRTAMVATTLGALFVGYKVGKALFGSHAERIENERAGMPEGRTT